MTRSRALAHAVPTGETHFPVKLHGENAPTLPVARKGQSGRLLRRPQRDNPAAFVAHFCTAVPTAIAYSGDRNIWFEDRIAAQGPHRQFGRRSGIV